MSNELSTADVVKQVRKHYAARRTINRNLRLGLYTGRNSNSTSDTLDWHERLGNELLRTLSHRLQGQLWEEHQLADRIACAKLDGQERPELRNRIRVLRNAIRTEISAS